MPLSTGVSIAKARTDLAEIVNRAAYGKEWIILQRHGKNVCAIVSMESLKMLDALEKLEDEADRRTLRQRRGEPAMSWEKARKLLSSSMPRKSSR